MAFMHKEEPPEVIIGQCFSCFLQNIRKIVEDIVSKEAADVHLALVEYRDHPPQDPSFVTRVHDFTSSVRDMKGWLDQCSAEGGKCDVSCIG